MHRDKISNLYQSGITNTMEVSRRIGIPKTTVYRTISKLKAEASERGREALEKAELSTRMILQSAPCLSKYKGPVFSFEITEFCYKGSNICAIQALGKKTHFNISGHFVIAEFD